MAILITNEELAALLGIEHVPAHKDELSQPNIKASVDVFHAPFRPSPIETSLTMSLHNLVSKEELEALLAEFPIEDMGPMPNKIRKRRTRRRSRSKINRRSQHSI
jgi:hypothetical protein